MMQYIKHMQRAMLLVVLMIGATSKVCADDLAEANIKINKVPADVFKNDVKTFTAGDVSVSVSGRTITLTVTPATDYYTKKSMITAEPMVTANAVPRRASILGSLTIEGTDDERSNTAPGSYTITVDGKYSGANITVKFYTKTANGITSLDQITDLTGTYVLTADVDASGFSTKREFTGTLDGGFHTIRNLDVPLFKTVDGGTIRNVILDNVNITTGYTNETDNTDPYIGNTGAIACVAKGTSRIYNCGILYGSVGGSKYVGGLVGLLDGTARVINCYSYANITNGSEVGGIVGYNNPTTNAANIQTMVMNCMFYGDITGGTTVSPVYGGTNIDNKNPGGLNTFNYYAYDKLKTKAISKYNCALAVEEKYLNRFEFYRLLLNSNKKLAAYYASTITSDPATTIKVNPSDMAKWVLETADRTNNSPMPYPILKAQGKYPSIINIDAKNAPDSAFVGRFKGGKLGNKTLSVTIKAPSDWTNAPDGAKLLDQNGDEISTSREILLPRTDKDEDRFNFNYDKVQLPYYNDYGTKNYTTQTDGNNKISRVVTGWKITAIDEVTGEPYSSANYDYTKTYSGNPEYFDYPNYNFADRKSSNKDLYSVSGRVFSQGAYFDVPYGVASITIEPYWGKAAYVADEYMDVVCKKNSSGRENYEAQQVTLLGKQFPTGKITINGCEQKVYTSISTAFGNGTPLTGSSVYDNAVVLVGNLHKIGAPYDGTTPFTLMSVDLDEDNEPDCSLILCNNDRNKVSPIRFDFLNVPGMAQAQKPNETNVLLNVAIYKTLGWFEITNTALMYFTQFEYENLASITKTDAPLILLGGYIDQFVSTQSTAVSGKTIYIHVGSNVLINSFGLGTHSDGSQITPHVPVSVTGGDYKGFYLTGTYNQDAVFVDDNAECYISSGRFGEVAGAAQERIGGDNDNPNNPTDKGNIHWQIYDADILNFFGGGINDAKPVQGNIITDIFNSHVGTFCGGPKFGNMFAKSDGSVKKVVRTTAEGCCFDKFFGAGYGGNSISRKKYTDVTNLTWDTFVGYYNGANGDKGKYYNGSSTGSSKDSGKNYGKKGPGVAIDFDYELFPWTKGVAGARFFVKFVSFSLAQCNDVYSNLTNCTINENFYGGGSLGKVTGTATSVLDGCTVKGNAFGAGYSATLPTIPVRDAGFTTNPNFNVSSGMYEPGVFSGTTDFTWKQVTNYPSEGGAGFDGTQVITKQNLAKTNLGSVGAVSLTIKGDSKIGTDGSGCVYGGGDESVVNGDIIVSIEDNAEVFGNVFGGGNNGEVGGSSKVLIEYTEPTTTTP